MTYALDGPSRQPLDYGFARDIFVRAVGATLMTDVGHIRALAEQAIRAAAEFEVVSERIKAEQRKKDIEL